MCARCSHRESEILLNSRFMWRVVIAHIHVFTREDKCHEYSYCKLLAGKKKKRKKRTGGIALDMRNKKKNERTQAISYCGH